VYGSINRPEGNGLNAHALVLLGIESATIVGNEYFMMVWKRWTDLCSDVSAGGDND
jgi:hypothetical protein